MSADNTKRSTILFPFEQTNFSQVEIQFHTNDEVSVVGVGIAKSQLRTISAIDGLIPIETSTIAQLGNGAVWTSGIVDTKNYGIVIVSAHSDQVSATDGLSIEFSSDGTNWHWTDVFTIAAGASKTFSVQPQARYMRIVYTNGVDTTTELDIITQLKPVYIKPSSHRIADSVSGQDDAELAKAILSGEDADGHYHNVGITHDGDLTISDNSDGLSIARGDVTGTSYIHKFGAAPDFDSADLFVSVWDGAEDAQVWENMIYDYSSTADIDYIVAEDDTDTQDVEILGLDANYNEVTQTITLTGNTPSELSTYLIRVFRMTNVGATDFADHVFCYVSGGTVTAGVPQVGADVRALVHADNNQTLMSLYTVPAGKTAYLRSFYAATAGAKKISGHTVKLLVRPFGQVFQLKHTTNIETTGTSNLHHEYVEPEVYGEKTDIEIRMDTSADAAGVAAGFDIVLVDD